MRREKAPFSPEAMQAIFGLIIIQERLKVDVEFGPEYVKKFDDAIRKKYGCDWSELHLLLPTG